MPKKEPGRVVLVRYLSRKKALRIAFADGFEGTILLSKLCPGGKQVGLLPAKVKIVDRGASVQMPKKDGGEFDICSDALRALLDPVFAKQIRDAAVAAIRRQLERDPNFLKELVRRLKEDPIVN